MLLKSGLNNPNYKHGMKGTRLYSIWANMKSRCYNSNTPQFKYYGKRGIKICDEWLNNFKSFYDWSINNGYSDELTIDRKDNDLGYFPDNCRWVTRKIQTLNTRKNHLITIDGKTKTIDEWCNEYKINRHTVHDRLRRGWNEKDAIVQPVQKKFRKKVL